MDDIQIKGNVPKVEPGSFSFAAIGLEHGHIYGMCRGLIEAGAELKAVYDPDASKVDRFLQVFPQAQSATSAEMIFADDAIQLVAGAAIPSERCELGIRVLNAGKHYFTAKTPFTTLEQLEKARRKTEETGYKWAIYYSERLNVESAIYAGFLIQEGAIGRVIQVMGTGPHRLRAETRPPWFFERKSYGGILCDIGSHQIEQFLHYTGAADAQVVHSKVANYAHSQYPELEDFGDATLIADNGATGYFRVDWFSPEGLGTWGDGRIFILGTEGSIELRKNIDLARDREGEHLYLVNHEGEKHLALKGKVVIPYFGQLIQDCLHGTEKAMTQAHAFKAAELCLLAQKQAIHVTASHD
ncbi:Gfo/Idh/MocA family protein [Desmospora activa]|uniref:Putative dehydrogenase n=1 Tax=Desmospora activa DSM 45169 TaxID=1121389 RepID=A0A2T4Z7U7_9BACL|nr:Gfo/Idh/MocA family oxidoreductase [Desmospora activa]PTM57960.1 putative dehydrogenase [Desmospora activa DSM 45169]